jgi:PrtD family type I secretion system ABC transporter
MASERIGMTQSSGLQSEISLAVSMCRRAFVGVALFTGMSNILMLSGSMFMLEIYDRVLPSRSVPTLVGLAALVLILYAFQAGLEMVRARIMGRIGLALDEALGERVYDAIIRFPLKAASSGSAGLQPLRDLDQMRSFMSSSGPTALFDLPWIPLYLGLCFAFHFWLGITALVGTIALVGITAITEAKTRSPLKEAAYFGQARNALAEAGRRNAEVLRAMGMGSRLAARWAKSNRECLSRSARVGDVTSDFGAISKVARMALQSMVLGVGAYLVIRKEATGGVMIAASILAGRALAPVDLAIANWKGFVSARQSRERLDKLLALLPKEVEPMELPAPAATLSVEGVTAVPPGGAHAVIQDVTFALRSGQVLGVIGPSASGKTSLARALVGVWLPQRGKIRLDGAALEQLSPDAKSRHIGYLPQDVELFDGTVAENISRFSERLNPIAVVAAASAAGAHDMILRLPDGYETRLGENGASISAGQRQRIGLARALFGNPFLVVLDEPNSNLDSEGDQALTQAIVNVRARGGILVIIAHRPTALAAVDYLLIMSGGRVQAWGPKEEILSKVAARQPNPSAPFRVVAERHGGGS